MSDESTEDVDTIEIDLVNLTVTIVAAYVTKNTLPARNLPALVTSVHAALAGLGDPSDQAPVETGAQKPTPAQIRKSITPDALISFVDGKSYKLLKRHLALHGLSPRDYRERYGLPSDYPMTAPNYSEQRSVLARSNGLGRPYGGQEAASEPAE